MKSEEKNLNLFKTRRPLIFSAPICGFSRYPFRRILSRFDLDLIFTEMISIDALYYQNAGTLPLLVHEKGLVPTAVQLVGSKPELFNAAVRRLEHSGFLSFDINLGCPVKKILKNEAGSALLQNPEKIYRIFKSLKEEFPHLTFSGKIRLGFSKKEQNFLETSKALQEGGAAWITVHGRTRCQMYEGEVNLSAVAAVKNSVSIPVIGNGNVFSPEAAARMLAETRCDGVMVARGMLGNPWLISQIRDYLQQGCYSYPSLEERMAFMAENLAYEQEFDPDSGYREFKKIGVKYLRGFPSASVFRQRILEAKSPEQMKSLLDEIRLKIHEFSEAEKENPENFFEPVCLENAGF